MIGVCILGSSGSIGQQTLSVIRRYPKLFKVVALVCNTSAEILCQQAEEFRPKFIGIADEKKKDLLTLSYECEIVAGKDAQIVAPTIEGVDVVVASIVGLAGLQGVISAIKAKKRIALANKETLVACGELVMNMAKQNGVTILPVDSEHSAIFQCLKAGKKHDLLRIILTASGGAFYNAKTFDDLNDITPEQAVQHPNWNMGKKISVDSATMMNKGLEIIEARWLFDNPNIDYIIQPNSIIHSMVEYRDGSIIAQIACPTMELPIQYALTYPKRKSIGGENRFDFTSDIRFLPPKEDVFPMPKYCKEALRQGGDMPCKINAANEMAVKLFLDGKIRFTDIVRAVEHILNTERANNYTTIEEIENTHIEITKKIAEKFAHNGE